MAARHVAPYLILSAALALMVGCEGGAGDASGATPAVSRAADAPGRDVEAPEVFQTTDQGLWDGRPSLGGVWVAHPEVDEPERVVIRNEANDRFVIGALFRRERENPGPAIQVSSDAAEALGILAGAPAPLNVTALRRDDTPAPATAVAAGPAAGTPPAAGTQVAAAEAPRSRNPFSRLFGRRRAEAPAPTPTPTSSAAPIQAAGLAAPGAVEASSLDAPASAGTTAPAVAAAPASAQAPAPASAAPAGDLGVVQIGFFSVEENARNTATALRQAGLAPSVQQETAKGKTFWRVEVGGLTSTAERDRILARVKDLGFSDAYVIRG